MEQLPRLTLGNPYFCRVRDEHTVLVDKTAKLVELTNNHKVFLARPRRMGKTLLHTTLTELFTHGARNNPYFEGLAVQEQWPDEWRYPVVYLSLFGLSDTERLEAGLCARIRSALVKAGFNEAQDPPVDVLNHQLERMSNLILGHKIAVLIDDRDYPLLTCGNDVAAYEARHAVLQTLMGWLYVQEGIAFTLVTGLGRDPYPSMVGDLLDISRDTFFADLTGFTSEEISTYFAPHLKRAAKLLGCSSSELVDQIQEHYGNLCFDHDNQVIVACPWSVTNFLQQVVDQPDSEPQFVPFRREGYRSDKLSMRPTSVNLVNPKPQAPNRDQVLRQAFLNMIEQSSDPHSWRKQVPVKRDLLINTLTQEYEVIKRAEVEVDYDEIKGMVLAAIAFASMRGMSYDTKIDCEELVARFAEALPNLP